MVLASVPHSYVLSAEKRTLTKAAANDLVMAWAQQRGTGSLRYILELGPQERGAKCNCVCISCGQPLTAVNAAKEKFSVRPHFRHPDGSPKHACMVLAARAALMDALLVEETFLLPRRRRHGRIEGLSGEFHEAWVELPPEHVRIANVEFHDRLRAILTLDDGRQLEVQLVGSAQPSKDGSVVPSIDILVDDPTIAAMAPEEIRRRLAPFLENACWRGHWQDDQLALQAEAAARDKAVEAFDWDDLDDLPKDTPPEVRRETLLHRLVKLILAQRKMIWLPALFVRSERQTDAGMLTKETGIPKRLAHLQTVVLEHRFGRIVPDVLAKLSTGENLLIEVTVTNRITDERIYRISREGCPALEIDIGRMGGRVTRAELEKLVVNEVAGKRWLFHPHSGQLLRDLEQQLDQELALQKVKVYRSGLAALRSPSEWAQHYLDAIEKFADSRQNDEDGQGEEGMSHYYLALTKEAAEGLSSHGYPEAEDEALFFWRRNIITRLLSIKKDRGVGYRLLTGWQVINTIIPEPQQSWKWHTLYLMATRVYKPMLTEEQAKHVTNWRNKARESIENNEMFYLRDTKYDRLLSLLFPELRVRLETPQKKAQGSACQVLTSPPSSRIGQPTTEPPLRTPPAQPFVPNISPMEDRNLWLKGRQLEDWKRHNPEAAKDWFGNKK